MVKEHSRRANRPDYAELQQEAQRAKLAADNARVFLDLHRAEHGC